tara:strand:- start:39120 stop:40019 length:900 start_codon:yes stop_codon:yes gene_type:complete
MAVNKPNFIVIGAMKSATTSLYSYLKQHPDIFMTKVKEPMFFNNYKNKKIYKTFGTKLRKYHNIEEYYSLFDDVDGQVSIGEASPSYIYSVNAPRLIKDNLPNVKIIAILRQPTDRAYSNFIHARRSGKEPIDDFQKAIEAEAIRIKNNYSPLFHYINKGYYSTQLSRYYNCFPKENIKVFLFEDIINDTHETLKNIFNFLGVDSSFQIDVSKKYNISGHPRGFFGFLLKKMRYYRLMPKFALSDYLPNFIIRILFSSVYTDVEKISKEFRSNITERYFSDEIKSLQNMIERDLSHWLK